VTGERGGGGENSGESGDVDALNSRNEIRENREVSPKNW